jgi:hypothetical protein
VSWNRLFIGLILSTIALVSCGNDPDPQAQFCNDAREFVDYQAGLGLAVFVPQETADFFEGSVERISALAESAPPTVADEVIVVRDAFVRLDGNLSSVGYDVTALTDEQLDTSDSDLASDAIDEFLATACRRDGDPFSGFADDPFAPLVLTPDEIERLDEQVVGQDEELEVLVATQLADEFGFSNEQATCIVEGLGMSYLASFTGSGAVTDQDSARFLEQLEICGVDPGALER